MKRLDVIQLAIILAGIISALFFVQEIPSFVIFTYRWFGEGLSGGYYMQEFIINIINLATYLIIAIYAIKHSKVWAEKLCDKTNFNGDIHFALNKTELIAAIFTGIGVYGLIKVIPLLLSEVYGLTNKAETRSEDLVSLKKYVGINIGYVILYIIVLVYAQVFADYLSKKINNTEPPDAIDIKEEQ